MKKLSFLLAILLLLSVCTMTACKEKKPEDTAPQSTTPEETTPEPGATVVHASVSLEALANYEIVVAKSSSEEADALTKELQQAMQNVFDLPFTLKTENAYNETQYEILIGETSRKESTEFLSKYNMTWRDYGYAIVGDKLVIRGTNEDGTLEALRAFLSYVRGHNKSEVFFTNANLYLVTDTSYPFPNLTINGIAAKQLSILCNEESLGGVAQIIRDAIIEASGIAVPIVTDKEIDVLENAIIVGDTSFIDIEAVPDEIAYPTGREYYIDISHGCIWLRAKTAAGYYSAATKIVAQFSGKGGDNVVITNSDGKGEDALPVMSFNLMAGKEDKRADSIVETILKYRPAVVGVQEATDNWMNILRQRLGDTYTIVGVGRNADGHDEHSAILYLTEEFDCIESGTKWLSDTPDVPGSKFAESHYTRIMTYAYLSRKSDGKEFLHVNTHLDYTLSPEEQATQVAQMHVIFNEIAKFSGIPTIITGDFNADFDSQVYRAVIDAGYVPTSAYCVPTYHALMGTTGEPSHIDFVFSMGMGYRSYYRVCTERVNNENVSDHYPVLSVLIFSSTGK
jgi:endonuclease/exonuclease/phosphatase family metal-dependent hydrolase